MVVQHFYLLQLVVPVGKSCESGRFSKKQIGVGMEKLHTPILFIPSLHVSLFLYC